MQADEEDRFDTTLRVMMGASTAYLRRSRAPRHLFQNITLSEIIDEEARSHTGAARDDFQRLADPKPEVGNDEIAEDVLRLSSLVE